MTSFAADPQALATAAAAFTAQVDPINTESAQAQALQGGTGNTGRQYGDQGTAYHAALTTLVQTLFTPMATRTTWVADTLTGTAADYRGSDHQAGSGLTSAGRGA